MGASLASMAALSIWLAFAIALLGRRRRAPAAFAVAVSPCASPERRTSRVVVRARNALCVVKIVHTAVWALVALCVVSIPVAALARQLRLASILSVVVWCEVAVLMGNRMRCPLTDAAAKYTDERAANFDIYLPVWLARNNQRVFGSLFVAGQAVLLWCCLR